MSKRRWSVLLCCAALGGWCAITPMSARADNAKVAVSRAIYQTGDDQNDSNSEATVQLVRHGGGWGGGGYRGGWGGGYRGGWGGGYGYRGGWGGYGYRGYYPRYYGGYGYRGYGYGLGYGLGLGLGYGGYGYGYPGYYNSCNYCPTYSYSPGYYGGVGYGYGSPYIYGGYRRW